MIDNVLESESETRYSHVQISDPQPKGERVLSFQDLGRRQFIRTLKKRIAEHHAPRVKPRLTRV